MAPGRRGRSPSQAPPRRDVSGVQRHHILAATGGRVMHDFTLTRDAARGALVLTVIEVGYPPRAIALPPGPAAALSRAINRMTGRHATRQRGDAPALGEWTGAEAPLVARDLHFFPGPDVAEIAFGVDQKQGVFFALRARRGALIALAEQLAAAAQAE